MKTKIIYLMSLILVSVTSFAQIKTKQIYETSYKSILIKMESTEQEWKDKLTTEQYYKLREKGKERPFTGEFVFTKDKGTNYCGGHLGQIFEDSSTETGKLYCVNSGSVSFEPKLASSEPEKIETITLGGGCFWCIEAIFEELKGVKSVESGYSGGETENPSYKQVCNGNTGHAEVVQLSYDHNIISLEELLEVFFTLHDPTTLNRQGADVGTQYRSAIFYHNEKQKEIAQNVISVLNKNNVFDNPIVTEISKFNIFYKAENYHQEYYELNKEQPYCRVVIKPKMDKLRKVFSDKLKQH